MRTQLFSLLTQLANRHYGAHRNRSFQMQKVGSYDELLYFSLLLQIGARNFQNQWNIRRGIEAKSSLYWFSQKHFDSMSQHWFTWGEQNCQGLTDRDRTANPKIKIRLYIRGGLNIILQRIFPHPFIVNLFILSRERNVERPSFVTSLSTLRVSVLKARFKAPLNPEID